MPLFSSRSRRRPLAVAVRNHALEGVPGTHFPTTRWFAALSVPHAIPGVESWVYYTGGTTGWLYAKGQMPRQVAVLQTQPGGVTGFMVLVELAPGSFEAEAQQMGYGPASFFRGETPWTTGLIGAGAPPMIGGRLQNPLGLAAPGAAPEQICYDASTSTLVGGALDGAKVVATADVQPDGLTTMTFVDPRDGMTKNGRFYACVGAPSVEQPTVCCLDRGSSMLVCDPPVYPHGVTVQVINETTMNGTVLAIVRGPDGRMYTVPYCEEPGFKQPPGEEMPPDEKQPPGDGGCPRCPAGYLLDTQTGLCWKMPPGWTPPPGDCTPWRDTPCCDSCAEGGPCTGCGDEVPMQAAEPTRGGLQANPPRRGIFSRRGR